MNGTLHYTGEKPKVGDKVYIVVSDVNQPTGFWVGKLTGLGMDYQASLAGLSCTCTAIITDSRAGERPAGNRDPLWRSYIGREPYVNYTVLTPETAVEHLLRKRAEDRAEINGLLRRIDIERATYQAALKAMVSDSGFARLEQLLQDFLAKLVR